MNSLKKHDGWFSFDGNDPFVILSPQDIEVLKEEAYKSQLKRFRYCLHQSEQDVVQEMVIAFHKSTEIPIHKHRNKSESFFIYEGIVKVNFYTEDKKVLKQITLGQNGSGYPCFYRLNSDLWHNLELVTEYAVIHEITTGPFVRNETEILK
ncbi:WbuC family cupin fold metalloprotein [Lentisphaera marina]|uniref:WbuC family cupin fold metalloprotein n=1 Tax=Lentisphaera marina TaxID=1111041 RepID=UPI0023657624|nr:WbuC family cupin fold metalloprotein [Lentisphaera marina]MDD7985731.1 WbuC family cupin fold metalloprotein [Lentisphaera marina]